MTAAAIRQNIELSDLWRSVLNGDTSAFEQIVRDHQSAVCAVAFCIVGDFAASQDIAQETFWAAWNCRGTLRDSNRLSGWLCGIARNLARQWRRKNIRSKEVAAGEIANQADGQWIDSLDDIVSREEESVVWNTLEQIPENYREVLVLYYRKGKSIEDVSIALGLSNEAARQRLVRGREMLRSRVSNLIEGVLDRTNPSRSFTARVMAGITSLGVAGSSSTAKAGSTGLAMHSSASATAIAAKVVGSGSLLGILGGLAGAILGLGGAWCGVYLPARFAPTDTERQLLIERGRIAMKYCLVFTAYILVATVAAVFVVKNALVLIAALLLGPLAFTIALTLHSLKTQALVRKLRSEISAFEDPNRLNAIRKNSKKDAMVAKQKDVKRHRKYGRKYTSSTSLFGLPLVDIQISDPQFNTDLKVERKRRRAKGWLAIGDVATGFVAIGGASCGVVSIGGAAVGLIAIGGVSAGLFSIAGLAVGWFAFGGGAIGYDVAGGAAIGLHAAAGGLAVAWHAAAGGAAFAVDFAVGGGAYANEVNTDLAKQVIEDETFIWLLKAGWISWAPCVALGMLPAFLAPLLYTDQPSSDF